MNIKTDKIYIFHEYGDKGHYRALDWFANSHENLKIKYIEFSITRKLIKSFIKLDVNLFVKQFINLSFIIDSIFSRNKIIIVGIAPYDWRLIFYYPFLRKNKYYYHTSNTSWRYKYPKKILAETDISKSSWRKFINNSNGVFCATNKTAKEISLYYNVSEISIVNHSIVSSYFLNGIATPYSKKLKTINCLFVGRLTECKGLKLIFNLIDRLSSDNFTFSFVGKGNMEEEVREYIANNKNCVFYGYIKNQDLKAIYDKADILLAPSIKTDSWEELFGMSIIESMACFTVPIATNHSGPSEIINSGFSGFLFSEKNYVQNSFEILQNFSNNISGLIEIKNNAYNESIKYSVENVFKKWNQVLKLEMNEAL
ncbi:glycosyltransferase involved in cell wall biosynthesis [Saonia flava]|uniref:Glycosyltransferase involved in cell wall biosynthesis n=1 Tax=Saonia flava TaxID=523696 RepID=A0A846QXH1_9FLAO|nr:glycosyltransferase [Saonia flava]NJB72648.1 glycosyltransferase involved in cell wall biosynthesis [Saonia flava]